MPLTACLVGGTRCSGNSDGSSWPSSFRLTRCIARANSSASSIPSRSMSESFQILPRMVLGSLDLTSSDLADAPVILPLIGFRFYTRQPITVRPPAGCYWAPLLLLFRYGPQHQQLCKADATDHNKSRKKITDVV